MTWLLDRDHSSVSFAVRHLMVGTTRGTIWAYKVDVDFDPAHPELGHVVAELDASSISTGNEQRDDHLRSADFLDVVRYPVITFTSTHVDTRGPDEFGLHGDLVIRGETRPIVLDVEYHGFASGPTGASAAGFTARGRFNRRQFGLSWNVAMDAGGVMVGDEVKVEIDIELALAAPVPAEARELAAAPA